MVHIIKITPNETWKNKNIIQWRKKTNQYFCIFLSSHFIKKNRKLNNIGSVKSDMEKELEYYSLSLLFSLATE